MNRLIPLLLFVVSFAQAQENTMNFGIQVRPLVPNEIFNGNAVDLANDTVRASVSDKLGVSVGMVIRYNFTERWSIETGINSIRRNYWIDAETVDTNITERFDIGMQTYEIPVQALYYVRLTEDIYMNALAGVSFNFFPSNHAKRSPDRHFLVSSKRKHWVSPSLIANIGFEYRTRNSGNFYLGASLHRPLDDMSQMTISYQVPGYLNAVAYNWIRGNFLSVDLKYFFPAEEREKKEPKKRE